MRQTARRDIFQRLSRLLKVEMLHVDINSQKRTHRKKQYEEAVLARIRLHQYQTIEE